MSVEFLDEDKSVEKDLFFDVYSCINPVFEAPIYLSNRTQDRSMKVYGEQLIKKYPRLRDEISELTLQYLEVEELMNKRVIINRNIILKKPTRNADPLTPYGNIAGMIFGGTVSRKRFETAREIAEAVSSMDAQQRISKIWSSSAKR